jgi:uncharacterized protein YfcZ (UPF0381/DUF406 family)
MTRLSLTTTAVVSARHAVGCCAKRHHTVVDDQVDNLPVERLAAMKADHEKIYP